MHAPNVTTLAVFFVGLGLCLWRAPHADRWHVVLCAVAALIWGTLPIFDPSTRTPGFGYTTMTLLVLALSASARRRAHLED
jgi:hypothetical protein